MRKVYLRADASSKIGYGHFIRSLALANMLKNDFECVFFTQTPTEYQRKEASNVCKLVELPFGNEKFNIFLYYIKGDEIVVLDNYFFNTDYQKEIKAKGCSLVCIDDMHDKHYVADIVINHGLNEASLFDIEYYTRLCLGFEWALLRDPFLSYVDSMPQSGHWLISFGGADYHNLTGKYISILNQINEVKSITAIIGDGFNFEDRLVNSSKIEILKNLSAQEMKEQMLRAEYAILPASGICLEALSCGCKILSGYYVDNQKEIYNNYKNLNYIFPLGDLVDACKKNIINQRLTIYTKNKCRFFK